MYPDLFWRVVYVPPETGLLSSATWCAGMRAQEHIPRDKLLGGGSFGCVYKAPLTEAGQHIAVKLVTAEEGDDEADRLSNLGDMDAEATVQCVLGDHPGIVKARRPAPLRLACEGDALHIYLWDFSAFAPAVGPAWPGSTGLVRVLGVPHLLSALHSGRCPAVLVHACQAGTRWTGRRVHGETASAWCQHAP